MKKNTSNNKRPNNQERARGSSNDIHNFDGDRMLANFGFGRMDMGMDRFFDDRGMGIFGNFQNDFNDFGDDDFFTK